MNLATSMLAVAAMLGMPTGPQFKARPAPVNEPPRFKKKRNRKSGRTAAQQNASRQPLSRNVLRRCRREWRASHA